jgi:hypothetical protein
MVPILDRGCSVPIEINYTDVLTDLRAKQTAIEQAINGITALVSLGALSGGPAQSANQSTTENPSGEIAPDAFFSLSIVEATKKYLAGAKRPKTTQEIAAALVAGGYNHTSKNFYSTIFSVLNREANKPTGDIVKVNERWGLAEWYPNRRREAPGRSKRNASEDSVNASSDADTEAEEDLNPIVPAEGTEPKV